MRNIIETENFNTCPLCKSGTAENLYMELRDRVYGAPGSWNLKRCLDCGLLFLNPRPTVKDIGKIYATYYTHGPKKPQKGLLSLIRKYIREGYLANKLGYRENVPLLRQLFGYLAYLHPEEQEIIKSSVMYMPSKDKGHALDVGCGAGETMKELRRFGWEVEGVDFDEKAVETARKIYKLNVSSGTLDAQHYPGNHFDVITMSHVIEHVHEPVALLTECRRILKPGGRMVVITPNTLSLGHKHFGVSWLPLDPPRHLVLFSRDTLAKAAREAGFTSVQAKSTVRGAYGIAIESHRIQTSQTDKVGQPPSSISEKTRGHLYQYLEAMALLFDPDAGEELLMMATK